MAIELSAAAKEAKKRIRAEYRKKNKAKIDEYNRIYWERKAREMGLTDEQGGADADKQQG